MSFIRANKLAHLSALVTVTLLGIWASSRQTQISLNNSLATPSSNSPSAPRPQQAQDLRDAAAALSLFGRDCDALSNQYYQQCSAAVRQKLMAQGDHQPNIDAVVVAAPKVKAASLVVEKAANFLNMCDATSDELIIEAIRIESDHPQNASTHWQACIKKRKFYYDAVTRSIPAFKFGFQQLGLTLPPSAAVAIRCAEILK